MGEPPSASERGGRPFKEASDLARAKGRGTHFMRGRVDVGRYLWRELSAGEKPRRASSPGLEAQSVPERTPPYRSPGSATPADVRLAGARGQVPRSAQSRFVTGSYR